MLHPSIRWIRGPPDAWKLTVPMRRLCMEQLFSAKLSVAPGPSLKRT